jgi:hypothetical protein
MIQLFKLIDQEESAKRESGPNCMIQRTKTGKQNKLGLRKMVVRIHNGKKCITN